MRLACLACLTLLAAVWVAACTPALNWRELRPEGSGVVMLFPCKPTAETRSLPLVGAPVQMTMWACEAAGLSFALAHAELGDAARVGPALTELRQALTSKLRGPPDVQAWVLAGAGPQDPSSRWRTEGVLPDGRKFQQEVALFAHGTRVFQMVAMGPHLGREAGETFFESVKVLPP